MADYLSRKDFVVLDELGYLPFAQSSGQLLFHLVSRCDFPSNLKESSSNGINELRKHLI